MKKFGIILVMLVCCGILAFAEVPSVFISESGHYRVYSEVSQDQADTIANKLEAYLDLFNSYFRYDLNALDSKLNVRIFSTKSRFDNYLTSLVGQTKNNFVYLQYSTLKKSELVGFTMDSSTAFETALLRHSFIQFLKSFIRNPPLWLQQGFAIFFEKSEYDPEHNTALYKENLNWLGTLKSRIGSSGSGGSGSSLLSLNDLVNPGKDIFSNQNELFHAEAWGFIMFLINSDNKNYNRLLWDALSALKPDVSSKTNEQAIQKKTLGWINQYLLYTDFISYIKSIKTYPDMVQDGVDLYSAGKYDEAEKSFIKAVALDGSQYIPYYYLGLINYSREDYSLAEYYYQSALMLGADPALIYYALGVNAFSDNRFEDAENYLREAAKQNPDVYEAKTENLLKRIDAAKMAPSGGK